MIKVSIFMIDPPAGPSLAAAISQRLGWLVVSDALMMAADLVLTCTAIKRNIVIFTHQS